MKIQLSPRQESIGRHLLFWAGIILLYYSIEVSRGRPDQFLYVMIRSLPGDMLATYFTYYVIVEKLLLRRRYWQAGLLLLVSAVVFSVAVWTVLYYTIVPRVYPPDARGPWLNGPAIIQIGIGLYYVAFMFSGLKLYRMWKKNREQQQELEQQHLRSELALLRAQINPHFLFNTLNNIDTLVFEDQQKASNSIVKLSQIMRYMLYDASAELVPLSKEIDCLNNLIELQRLRLKEAAFIQFQIEGNPQGKLIPPMLLLPFVENTFKHGSVQGPSPGILVELTLNAATYQLRVSNRLKQNKGVLNDASGLGLQTVRRRLDLIYGRNYTLEVEQDQGHYHVRLKIPSMPIETTAPAPATPNGENQPEQVPPIPAATNRPT